MYQALALTGELRRKLKEPLGELLRGEPEEIFKRISERLSGDRKLITVGDVVTANALRAGLSPWASIVDGRAMRKPLPGGYLRSSWRRRLSLRNPPGTISREAWGVVGDAIREGSTLVVVEGEEDLLALLAILLAPEGSLVVYGQPGEGVVVVEVDEASKEMVRGILGSMRPLGG